MIERLDDQTQPNVRGATSHFMKHHTHAERQLDTSVDADGEPWFSREQCVEVKKEWEEKSMIVDEKKLVTITDLWRRAERARLAPVGPAQHGETGDRILWLL